ncbi:serine/threonine protein kinase [Helicobacter sp. faydin-H20]|uniref:aromatic amino acid transport family protein n=2 Tax=Helicobacter anatolicus TaxID=2905874 RepID=UPI001E3837A3|nr:aromatic amino acid transport family protein [Helicobacter anatolicus]MCE3037045.1 serine/threonine protein kinase [Helicobacter anatolicus]
MWILSLYGTAIGAGVLFLPINAGMGGLIPLLVMLVLAFPLTYFTHRALCRFVLEGSEKSDDITVVGEKYFGKFGGGVLTLLYFFAIFPILLVYSVGITNNISSFMIHQLGMAEPDRLLLSFCVVAVLMAVVSFGEEIIVKTMSAIVFPFIAVLVISALWLIPKWNGALFENISFSGVDGQSLWVVMLLILPTMVFAFNHSPIISSLAVHCKEQYGKDADKKASSIIAGSNILMLITVMFFVFSCAMCLSPEEFQKAKAENLPILSYLANHFSDMTIFAFLAPIVAFVAMSKSFFGHYLGAKEGLNRILFRITSDKISLGMANKITGIITFIVAWLVAYKDPNVLGIIESIGGPILAIILYLMPLYAIYKFPQLHKYKNFAQNIFIFIFGLITISTAIYKMFFLGL